jgi:hypothetical protein
VRAIRLLEEAVNPYTLSEFANNFRIEEDPWTATEFDDFGLKGICDI